MQIDEFMKNITAFNAQYRLEQGAPDIPNSEPSDNPAKPELISEPLPSSMNQTENLILYDWFAVTSKTITPNDFITLLGLKDLEFEDTNGYYGFRGSYYYDGVRIHYDHRSEDLTAMLEMSGEGCRVFETFGHGDWESLFDTIHNYRSYDRFSIEGLTTKIMGYCLDNKIYENFFYIRSFGNKVEDFTPDWKKVITHYAEDKYYTRVDLKPLKDAFAQNNAILSMINAFENKETYNPNRINRLDVAFDDHSGLLDIEKISNYTRFKFWVSPASVSSWKSVYSNKGTSAYIGSPQSNVLIRFYDKAAEKGLQGKHWVRCEIQMRKENARNFILNPLEIGVKFKGVLNNYLRYVVPQKTDSNKWRWETQPFWDKFTENVGKISLFTKKDIEYNMSRLERYVLTQAGNCIETYIKCLGLDYFKTKLEKRETHLKKHHKHLIAQYKKDTGDKDFGKKEEVTTMYNDRQSVRNECLTDYEKYTLGYNQVRNLFTQQTEAIYDEFGNRWLQCAKCNKIMPEIYFTSYGGKDSANLGTCKYCERINK